MRACDTVSKQDIANTLQLDGRYENLVRHRASEELRLVLVHKDCKILCYCCLDSLSFTLFQTQLLFSLSTNGDNGWIRVLVVCVDLYEVQMLNLSASLCMLTR